MSEQSSHNVDIDDLKNGILPWHMMLQNSIEAAKLLNKARNNMPGGIQNEHEETETTTQKSQFPDEPCCS